MAKFERVDYIKKIRDLQEENKNDPFVFYVLKVAEDIVIELNNITGEKEPNGKS
jgi:hypothetical protein